jgi:hypothetical protein
MRLELPCPIQHGLESYEIADMDDESETNQKSVIPDSNSPNNTTKCFPTNDIQHDLHILSLAMAEQCGLRPPK